MLWLKTPKWVSLHLFRGKNFNDLSKEDLQDLKYRLSKFRTDRPEISIVIPAWNEGDNIYRTLSSLANNVIGFPTELIVINNNSTDHTQRVLQELEVITYFQPLQGTAYARQLGLELAKGKYHLCADSDTIYPPEWVKLMIEPLQKKDDCVGVYGRYSFIPHKGNGRILFVIYELITGLLVRLRKMNREYLNVLGFNMGFIRTEGLNAGGFTVTEPRRFDNKIGSDYFVEEAEDGRMAINLMKNGKLKLITHPGARVFTSSRRLEAEGGIIKSFVNRIKIHCGRLTEYLTGS